MQKSLTPMLAIAEEALDAAEQYAAKGMEREVFSLVLIGTAANEGWPLAACELGRLAELVDALG